MNQSAVKSRQSALGTGGFSLIEIVITLVVLSIAAVGVLSVFSSTQRGSVDPLLLNQTVQLAQEKMDEAIALKKSGGFNAVVPDPGGVFPAPFAAFNWVRTVDCVSPPPPANALNNSTGAPPCASGYAHVTVTVTQATIGSISMDTVVTDH
jgi:prepilin-type N-terminal cleavage/methylation domain-containing protein